MSKTIINNCKIGDKFILEIDGGYFGYDNDPAYPETIYKDKNKAYVFTDQADALSLTKWHDGKKFVLIPI